MFYLTQILMIFLMVLHLLFLFGSKHQVLIIQMLQQYLQINGKVYQLLILMDLWSLGSVGKISRLEAAFSKRDIFIVIFNTPSGISTHIISSQRLDDDEWHHFSIVIDQNQNMAYQYIDGFLDNTFSLPIAAPFQSPTWMESCRRLRIWSEQCN